MASTADRLADEPRAVDVRPGVLRPDSEGRIAAAPVADLATKPTSTFTVEAVQDRARVYAHLSQPLPLRIFWQIESIVSWLANEMAQGVYAAIEADAICGNGSWGARHRHPQHDRHDRGAVRDRRPDDAAQRRHGSTEPRRAARTAGRSIQPTPRPSTSLAGVRRWPADWRLRERQPGRLRQFRQHLRTAVDSARGVTQRPAGHRDLGGLAATRSCS